MRRTCAINFSACALLLEDHLGDVILFRRRIVLLNFRVIEAFVFDPGPSDQGVFDRLFIFRENVGQFELRVDRAVGFPGGFEPLHVRLGVHADQENLAVFELECRFGRILLDGICERLPGFGQFTVVLGVLELERRKCFVLPIVVGCGPSCTDDSEKCRSGKKESVLAHIAPFSEMRFEM